MTIESRVRPRTVAGDPVLLERLFINLVDNAIAYNTSGGWVRIDVTESPALVVSNTGHEIPADAVDTLFEPWRWFQAVGLTT